MIAVTGTSGYLGRALLPALQNHFGRYPNVLSLGRQSPTNTQSRYLDLRAGADFRASLEGVKTLVHCAGLAHTRATAEEYEHVNVRATMSLADAAIAQGVGHFIYVSSMNVVPPDARAPNDNAGVYPRPATAYAASKWQAEQALEALLKGSGCRVTIIRPALVYDQELAANLAVLAAVGRRIPFQLPDVGSRTMLSRADFVALVIDLITSPPADTESVRRVAAFDGESYSSRRIGAALLGKRSLHLPLSVWHFAAKLRDALGGRAGDSTWSSLAGEHWTGNFSPAFRWQPKWTLESCLAANPYPPREPRA